MIAILVSPAGAESRFADASRKLADCRFDHSKLIGLDRTALRQRCGIWEKVNTETREGEFREQIIYRDGPVEMDVYLRNGKVISVQNW